VLFVLVLLAQLCFTQTYRYSPTATANCTNWFIGVGFPQMVQMQGSRDGPTRAEVSAPRGGWSFDRVEIALGTPCRHSDVARPVDGVGRINRGRQRPGRPLRRGVRKPTTAQPKLAFDVGKTTTVNLIEEKLADEAPAAVDLRSHEIRTSKIATQAREARQPGGNGQ
jgi:hypothetical protein